MILFSVFEAFIIIKAVQKGFCFIFVDGENKIKLPTKQKPKLGLPRHN